MPAKLTVTCAVTEDDADLDLVWDPPYLNRDPQNDEEQQLQIEQGNLLIGLSRFVGPLYVQALYEGKTTDFEVTSIDGFNDGDVIDLEPTGLVDEETGNPIYSAPFTSDVKVH